jgi:hypothetical protein
VHHYTIAAVPIQFALQATFEAFDTDLINCCAPIAMAGLLEGALSALSFTSNKTEIEKKLDEALSKANWGATSTLLREIATSTNDP